MSYTELNVAHPVVGGTRQAELDATRANFVALLDMLVTAGEVPGFDSTPSGGTAAQPAVFYWKNGATWIRIDTTWGTTGGSANKVVKEAYYISINSGSSWDPLSYASGKFVATTTYDSSGFWTGTTWGSTP